MAKYEHLPIYKNSIDLVIIIEKNVKNMSRYNKYGIGLELRKKSYQILSSIIRANSVSAKKEVLEELRIQLEELKQFLFVAKETQALPSFGFYKELMLKLENIIKQNEGWIKSQKNL